MQSRRGAARLRAIGFELVYTSMRSEACYYALPGYLGLLRVSAHKNKRPNQVRQERPVVAKLTYTPGTKFKSQVQFDNHMAYELGRYLLAHSDMKVWPK
jgi:hypothetical protein